MVPYIHSLIIAYPLPFKCSTGIWRPYRQKQSKGIEVVLAVQDPALAKNMRM